MKTKTTDQLRKEPQEARKQKDGKAAYKLTMTIKVADVGGIKADPEVIQTSAIEAIENITTKGLIQVESCDIKQTEYPTSRKSWDGYDIPAKCKDKECGKCLLNSIERKSIGCTVPIDEI